MKSMKLKPIIFAFVALAMPSPLATATAGETNATAAWQSLFNGRDLTGWSPHNDGTFEVTNGVLRISGGNGWLRTDQTYGDFVLELECRGLETNYNSGIFVRSAREGVPWATNVWQINLRQNAFGELWRGRDRIVTNSAPAPPPGEWVKFRIEARSNDLTLLVNGQRVWQFDKLAAEPGHVGLQAEKKAVEFRNLRLQASTMALP